MDISEIDLKGKYVIMKTKAALNLDIIDRVYFCDSGFGCDPRKSGTKIYGYFVTDPERVYMRRYDAITLATDDEVKQAQERFRNNKTWALENWRDLENESICDRMTGQSPLPQGRGMSREGYGQQIDKEA